MEIQKSLPKRAFAGLAGSSLTIVSPPAPQVAKVIEKEVLVHFCFDQAQGESKKDRCSCDLRVSRNRAIELVDAKQADFFLVRNPKTEKLVKFHRAIVIRRVMVAGELLYALDRPVKADPRDVKHQQIKTKILQDARGILRKLFKSGHISHADLRMSDENLVVAISNPDSFLARIKSYKSDWTKISLHWWANILGFHRLSVDAARYLEHAARGAGLPIHSKTILNRLDEDGNVRDNGRATGANFVPRKWNGGYIYNSGHGPDSDENDN